MSDGTRHPFPADLSKGEGPGHRFRGNQWTGGMPEGGASGIVGAARSAPKYPNGRAMKEGDHVLIDGYDDVFRIVDRNDPAGLGVVVAHAHPDSGMVADGEEYHVDPAEVTHSVALHHADHRGNEATGRNHPLVAGKTGDLVVSTRQTEPNGGYHVDDSRPAYEVPPLTDAIGQPTPTVTIKMPTWLIDSYEFNSDLMHKHIPGEDGYEPGMGMRVLSETKSASTVEMTTLSAAEMLSFAESEEDIARDDMSDPTNVAHARSAKVFVSKMADALRAAGAEVTPAGYGMLKVKQPQQVLDALREHVSLYNATLDERRARTLVAENIPKRDGTVEPLDVQELLDKIGRENVIDVRPTHRYDKSIGKYGTTIYGYEITFDGNAVRDTHAHGYMVNRGWIGNIKMPARKEVRNDSIVYVDQVAGIVGAAAQMGEHPRGRGWTEADAQAEAQRIASDLAEGRRSTLRGPRSRDPHFKRRVLEVLPQHIDRLAKGDVPGHEFHGNQWTGGVLGRSATGHAFGPTPADQQQAALQEAVDYWTRNPGFIRAGAEQLFGRNQAGDFRENEPDSWELVAKALTDHLRDHHKQLKVLYRGISPGEEAARELTGIVVGQTVDIPLLGASRAKNEATHHFHGGRPGGVMFVIQDPAAFAVNDLGKYQEYASEDEWITGGRFRVVSVEQAPAVAKPIKNSTLSDQFNVPDIEIADPNAPMTIVTLKHEALFDSDLAPGQTRESKPAPPAPEPVAPAPAPEPPKRKRFLHRLLGG